MSWKGTTTEAAERAKARTGSAAWRKQRARIMRRDGRICRQCGAPARDAHHLLTEGQPGYDDDENIVALCLTCHVTASGKQGAAARWSRGKLHRDKEPHPGLLPDPNAAPANLPPPSLPRPAPRRSGARSMPLRPR